MTGYTVSFAREPDQSASSARQDRLAACVAGERVTLERAADDALSIRVVSADGHLLGHINRQSAKWIAERLEKGKFLDARIAPLVSGQEHDGRVQLSIHTEPEPEDKQPFWKRLFGR